MFQKTIMFALLFALCGSTIAEGQLFRRGIRRAQRMQNSQLYQQQLQQQYRNQYAYEQSRQLNMMQQFQDNRLQQRNQFAAAGQQNCVYYYYDANGRLMCQTRNGGAIAANQNSVQSPSKQDQSASKGATNPRTYDEARSVVQAQATAPVDSVVAPPQESDIEIIGPDSLEVAPVQPATFIDQSDLDETPLEFPPSADIPVETPSEVEGEGSNFSVLESSGKG